MTMGLISSTLQRWGEGKQGENEEEDRKRQVMAVAAAAAPVREEDREGRVDAGTREECPRMHGPIFNQQGGRQLPPVSPLVAHAHLWNHSDSSMLFTAHIPP